MRTSYTSRPIGKILNTSIVRDMVNQILPTPKKATEQKIDDNQFRQWLSTLGAVWPAIPYQKKQNNDFGENKEQNSQFIFTLYWIDPKPKEPERNDSK